ncbi:MAG: FHA domain-containing protein [Actinobacteria bacterium]|nr:FHA domain-containing protein [Actinomycetota bacterium]MCL6095692.1 FHA domain-containing protein [Actinomycetota bacterium]
MSARPPTNTTTNSTGQEGLSSPKRRTDYAMGTTRSRKSSAPLSSQSSRQIIEQGAVQAVSSIPAPIPPRQSSLPLAQRSSQAGSQTDSSPGLDPPPRDSYRLDRLTLKVVEPVNRAGVMFPVQGEAVIGRGASCDIKLPNDTFASSKHARIYSQDGLYWLEDLGSTNGTYLNSHRVSSPQRLGQGDRIQLGATVLEVHS